MIFYKPYSRVKVIISISNGMVSSAIWEKHAGVSFSKTSKIFYVLEKLMSACLSQTSRETILLLDNELHILNDRDKMTNIR